MILKYIKLYSLIVLVALSNVTLSNSQSNFQDAHIKVSLRMIGHQILLNSGDSTSRILPIEKEKGRYKIQFESEFEFQPEELVTTINKVVKETNIATDFMVEVENCISHSTVYSYESRTIKSDQIPCRSRIQPTGCHILFFTILDSIDNVALVASNIDAQSNRIIIEKSQLNKNIVLFASLLFFMIGFVYFKIRKPISKIDPDLIEIGSFMYDKRNMVLSRNRNNIELSSKESDLLMMLFSAANTTLERENILNRVWGDEGNYIGRTLDVFISKLRKKLAADDNLKIINIRGVGYKFVVNGTD